MSPEEGHFYVQTLGVGCLVVTGMFASWVRVDEPVSVVPVLLVYAVTEAVFRLAVRLAGRPLRKRNLVFIA